MMPFSKLRPRRWRPLAGAVAGLAAPAIWYSAMIVMGATTAHYNPISRFGSDLSIGPHGWIMRLNFCLYGVLELAFALSLYRYLSTDRAGKRCAQLVGMAGCAWFVAGIFVTDPNGKMITAHGAVHVAAAMVVFSSLTAACLLGGRHFVGRGQRHLATFSRVVGWSTPPLLVSTWVLPSLAGLLQRIMIGLDFVFLVMLAVQVWQAVIGTVQSGPASEPAVAVRVREPQAT